MLRKAAGTMVRRTPHRNRHTGVRSQTTALLNCTPIPVSTAAASHPSTGDGGREMMERVFSVVLAIKCSPAQYRTPATTEHQNVILKCLSYLTPIFQVPPYLISEHFSFVFQLVLGLASTSRTALYSNTWKYQIHSGQWLILIRWLSNERVLLKDTFLLFQDRTLFNRY